MGFLSSLFISKEEKQQREQERKHKQELIDEVYSKIERIGKMCELLQDSMKTYEMSIAMLKQNYRHAVSLRSSQMRMKAYKELQDSLIFAEASLEAMKTFAKESKKDLLFIQEVKNNGEVDLPPLNINIEELINELNKLIDCNVEDEEVYMDIKCFCEEQLK